MNEWLLALLVFIFCLIITSILFPDKDKVKYTDIPPKTGMPMITTDIVITKDTKWLTENEFFGKPTIKQRKEEL